MWIALLSLALAGDDDPEPLPDAPLALVPFGVPQFAWGAPGRGAAYAVSQAAGLGLAIPAGLEMDAAQDAGDDAGTELYQGLMVAGVGVAAVSYAVQLLDGSRLAQERAARAAEAHARREAVAWFDAGRAPVAR